jgi:hypothetical protein
MNSFTAVKFLAQSSSKNNKDLKNLALKVSRFFVQCTKTLKFSYHKGVALNAIDVFQLSNLPVLGIYYMLYFTIMPANMFHGSLRLVRTAETYLPPPL